MSVQYCIRASIVETRRYNILDFQMSPSLIPSEPAQLSSPCQGRSIGGVRVLIPRVRFNPRVRLLLLWPEISFCLSNQADMMPFLVTSLRLFYSLFR